MPSELQVNTITEATSGSGITFAKDIIPATPLSHRNLIINGAMRVAQRGTSSTSAGLQTVDRFATTYNHNSENPTQSQHALTSSDTGPYEEGFRNSFHILNGNNPSDNNDDRVAINYKIEAQDLANSGWDYKSSSSYITLSFWCKSSVAQNFYGRLQTQDGTQQGYAFETGSLTANTWTKITKTIPGNSNLDFNDDNGSGLLIEFVMFRGTDKTGPMSLDTWGAYNSAIRVPDMTSTWYTTDDATWEITGLQLERGSVATPFEHRSYGEELQRCQRYHQRLPDVSGSGSAYASVGTGFAGSGTQADVHIDFKTAMRTNPSFNINGFEIKGSGFAYNVTSITSTYLGSNSGFAVVTASSGSMAGGDSVNLRRSNNSSHYIELDAEL